MGAVVVQDLTEPEGVGGGAAVAKNLAIFPRRREGEQGSVADDGRLRWGEAVVGEAELRKPDTQVVDWVSRPVDFGGAGPTG